MSHDMSTAAGCVATMRRLIVEVQQNGNYDLIDQVVDPNFIDRTARPGGLNGRDSVHAIMRYIHSTISDLKIEIVHCISDGKVVATTKILRGTQVGAIYEKPATGRKIELRLMDFWTVVNNKFKEHWVTIGPIVDV